MLNLKATIFDMDGVLVDSEIQWSKLEKEFYPKLGVDLNNGFQKEILGLRLKDTINLIRSKYNPEISEKEAYDLYNDAAKKIYTEFCNLIPGTEKLLQILKNKNIKMGIGSSSPMEWIDYVLNRFDLKDFFDFVYSTETMDLPGKPDPAIYNRMITDMNVEKSEAVIFEDSNTGFRSALSSGANVVAVLDKRWCSGDYSEANLVVNSLGEEELYNFLGIANIN